MSSKNKTEIIEEESLETQLKDSVTLQQIHSAVESLRKERYFVCSCRKKD